MDAATRSVETSSSVGIGNSVTIMYPVIHITVANRSVVSSVRVVVYDTAGVQRTHIPYVPWSPNISWGPEVDITGAVIETTVVVIEDTQATYAYYATVAIMDLRITRLDDTSVVIIVDRDIFDLDHSAVVVVLHIRIVIVTRVKIQLNITGTDVHIHISSFISPEIDKVELSIGEYRKFNCTFNEHIGITIVGVRSCSSRAVGVCLGCEAHKQESEY